MYWYRVDLTGGGSRFVEINLEPNAFHTAIERGDLILVHKQVMMIQVAENQMTFVTLDKLSPLLKTCKADSEFLNTKHIICYGLVDTNTDIWKSVRQGALGESPIVTPNQGLITPS